MEDCPGQNMKKGISEVLSGKRIKSIWQGLSMIGVEIGSLNLPFFTPVVYHTKFSSVTVS